MDDPTQNNSISAWRESSHLDGGNAAYIEALYEAYLQNPASVDAKWRTYFETLPRIDGVAQDISHSQVQESFRRLTQATPVCRKAADAGVSPDHERKQIRVLQMINAYRFRGHQIANLDPLGLRVVATPVDLRMSFHQLTDADLDTVFDTGSLVGKDRATLREILLIVKETYCGSVGAEYMHLIDIDEKRWMQQRIEGSRSKPNLSNDAKKRILHKLTAAESLERYLHNKYVGQKRFSLEGAESLIPLLDEIIHRSAGQGAKEVIMGMAHRGRLNVLVNILGKMPADLFLEFEGKAKRNGFGSGDVKYHMGFSADVESAKGLVHLALAFNPSHLEIGNPVVEGSVRARQDRRNDQKGTQVLPILIHGDAAFSGQGVVMETFNMSQSRGYSTKGTIHIIVNNQIGFTTSNQKDSRSTLYSSDVAKMVAAPILHVNGDDPEAVLFVTQIAIDYRMTFHKDVVIDLMCYRRHGHSEADEPAATQPMMYQTIRAKPTTLKLYQDKLQEEAIVSAVETQAMVDEYRSALDQGNAVVQELAPPGKGSFHYGNEWAKYRGGYAAPEVLETGVTVDALQTLWKSLEVLPAGFELHPSVARVMENRHKMAAGAMPIDWGFAETMAYATLITDGYDVRISGQDCGRGTFFHRHAVLHNQKSGKVFIPLRRLSKQQQRHFLVINSLLSEEAVLAFEYGYATTSPNTLVIWEAQFGDFANNAQVVIDQFISAGEQKWNRLCGLTLLLPHGLEGQGPEHSSARLERYMQLSAEHNWSVCVPTGPAQMFHLLRRQMRSLLRKPLVVMTPKSLLRHRLAVNSLEDLAAGHFQEVIGELDPIAPEKVKRIVLCSGKVYFDLLDARRAEELSEVVIIRIEQVYPFPTCLLEQEFNRYPNAQELVWCQEEPKNQGIWYASNHHFRTLAENRYRLIYAGRPVFAAPACGYQALHVEQQHKLIAEALK